MQKTGEVSLYKTNLVGAGRRYGLFALLFICALMVSFYISLSVPMKAYASDLTWNTAEGLGNLPGKTVGSGKMFLGEHNNSGYPDNFKIEFKYYDSEGNIQTWDSTCNLRKGKAYSVKIDIPVEFSDFKHWQVIGTGSLLSGESPSVWVVLMPVGKAGPVTFKTVSKTDGESDLGAQTSGGTGALTAKNGEVKEDTGSKEIAILRTNESESSDYGINENTGLKGGKTQKLASNRTSVKRQSQNSNVDNQSEGEAEDSKEIEGLEEDVDYLAPLRDELSKAVALGKKATIYWSAGTAIPRDIMLTLHDNPNLTLVFSYRYEHKNYVVTIPGKNVVIEENVPWYGPLNLYGRYGGKRN